MPPPNQSQTVETAKGLEGVIIGPSSITFLDGLEGRMIYRGYNVLDLAGKVTFEEVVHLLWDGDLPNRAQLDQLSKSLAQFRALPREIIEHLRKIPPKANPMDVL